MESELVHKHYRYNLDKYKLISLLDSTLAEKIVSLDFPESIIDGKTLFSKTRLVKIPFSEIVNEDSVTKAVAKEINRAYKNKEIKILGILDLEPYFLRLVKLRIATYPEE